MPANIFNIGPNLAGIGANIPAIGANFENFGANLGAIGTNSTSIGALFGPIDANLVAIGTNPVVIGSNGAFIGRAIFSFRHLSANSQWQRAGLFSVRWKFALPAQASHWCGCFL